MLRIANRGWTILLGRTQNRRDSVLLVANPNQNRKSSQVGFSRLADNLHLAPVSSQFRLRWGWCFFCSLTEGVSHDRQPMPKRSDRTLEKRGVRQRDQAADSSCHRDGLHTASSDGQEPAVSILAKERSRAESLPGGRTEPRQKTSDRLKKWATGLLSRKPVARVLTRSSKAKTATDHTSQSLTATVHTSKAKTATVQTSKSITATVLTEQANPCTIPAMTC